MDSDAHFRTTFSPFIKQILQKVEFGSHKEGKGIINVKDNNKAYIPEKIKLMQLLKPNTETDRS